MRQTASSLANAAGSPWTKILLGTLVLITVLWQEWETIHTDAISGDFGTHHGVFLLGMAHLLSGLPGITGAVSKLVAPGATEALTPAADQDR